LSARIRNTYIGLHELEEVFDRFAADPSAWLAIITGEGDKAFCGNDLKFQAAGNDTTWPASGFGGLTSAVSRLDKPLIAAVRRRALGGGFRDRFVRSLIATEHASACLTAGGTYDLWRTSSPTNKSA
jgi:crotonobetainyl-CoA hydratase